MRLFSATVLSSSYFCRVTINLRRCHAKHVGAPSTLTFEVEVHLKNFLTALPLGHVRALHSKSKNNKIVFPSLEVFC